MPDYNGTTTEIHAGNREQFLEVVERRNKSRREAKKAQAAAPSVFDNIVERMDRVATGDGAEERAVPAPAAEACGRFWEAPKESRPTQLPLEMFPFAIEQYYTPLVEQLRRVPFEPRMSGELIPRVYGAMYNRTKIYFDRQVVPGMYTILSGTKNVRAVGIFLNYHSLNPDRYEHPPGNELEDRDVPMYDVELRNLRVRPATLVLEGTVAKKPEDGPGQLIDANEPDVVSIRVFVDSQLVGN